MAPPVTPPATLPAEFDKWDAGATPSTLPGNFDFGTQQPAAPYNYADAGPAKKPTALEDFEADIRMGGGRTAVGRLLGRLQGRGDQGFYGVEKGVAPAAADMMASPVLGVTHALQGVQEIPQHPIAGTAKSVMGGLEAATIPGMMMGGPEVSALTDAIPSTRHAGQVFQDVMQHAGKVPVQIESAANPLMRLYELGQRGSTLPKAVSQLAKRVTDPDAAPIAYQEARDFASKISQLSADEKMTLTPTMKAALGDLRTTLHKDIGAAADTVGKGEDYARALKEYAQASRAGKVVTALTKAAGAGLIGSAIYSKGRGALEALSGR